MGRIDIILPDNLERRFREAIRQRLGLGRGNITRVIQQCIEEWIIREDLDITYTVATALSHAKNIIYNSDLSPPQKEAAYKILISRFEEEITRQVERMAKDIVERFKWIV